MKYYRISSSILKGEIAIPPSKSQTLRAILFGMMAKGKTTLSNFLISPDTQAMMNACRLFGASIDYLDHKMTIRGIEGKISHTEDVIDAGNSGIVLRFCSAIGALAHSPVVITGDHSIRHQRPMKPLIDGLKQLGVLVQSMRGDDLAPIILKGPIQPGQIIVQGEDSQPVSALLIALAFAKGTSRLKIVNMGEKPWVELTLHWLNRLGIDYKRFSETDFEISGNSTIDGFDYRIPGDLSSLAFPMTAALITQSELKINNVDLSDPQGDKALIDVVKQMGGKIDFDTSRKQLLIQKNNSLKGMRIDVNPFIDAIPALAVLACFAEGETILYHAKNARNKECNRLRCLAIELKKMGADIEENIDGLRIRHSNLHGAKLNSHYDHRLAMAFSIAGLAASSDSEVLSVDCIDKSYPNFKQAMNQCGANIR
jgi:3-phosphoshikimate 1-carboxyvinyltransferase